MTGATSETSVTRRPTGEFLAGIASTEPSPGSGAAGALALALATSCALKAVRISLKHDPDNAELGRAAAQLEGIGRQAIAQADEDARHFAELIAAMQRPHDSEAAATAREREITTVSRALTAIAEHLLHLGDDVARLVTGIAPQIAPNMTNDVTAALALVEAAAAIQRANAAESREHVR